MFAVRSLQRAGQRVVLAAQTRAMAKGAFPSSMHVKKQYPLEEWNSLRETSNLTFRLNGSNLHLFFIFIIGMPYFLYTQCRNEMLHKNVRQFREVC